MLSKVTPLEGGCRVARYRILAGSSTVTVHREFGFSYALDVREVFFNPRIASERMRVALQVFFGEEVLVPFAGAGPFVVPVAARGARVVAVGKNPAACRWLSAHCRFNGVEETGYGAVAARRCGNVAPCVGRWVFDLKEA